MTVTKFVDLVTRIPDPLSLHFYDFSAICFAFLKFTDIHWNSCKHTLERKKTNYNRALRRPSPPLQLAGGVLLGRAYRGCNGEARGRVRIEEHPPWSAFEGLTHGFELVGVNGGAVVRFVGAGGEGWLGVGEQGAHEQGVSLWMLLG